MDCAGAHPGRSDGAHTNCSILSLEKYLKLLTKAPIFVSFRGFGVDGRCSEQTLGVGGGRRRLPDKERKRDFCHRELNNSDHPLQPLFVLNLSPDLSLWGSVYISRDFLLSSVYIPITLVFCLPSHHGASDGQVAMDHQPLLCHSHSYCRVRQYPQRCAINLVLLFLSCDKENDLHIREKTVVN